MRLLYGLYHSIKWANKIIPIIKLLYQRTLSGSSQIWLATLTRLQAIRCKATNLTVSEVTKSFISVFTGMIGTWMFDCLFRFASKHHVVSCHKVDAAGLSNRYLVESFPKSPGNAGSGSWLTVQSPHSESFSTEILRIVLRKDRARASWSQGIVKEATFGFSLISHSSLCCIPGHTCPSGCQSWSLPFFVFLLLRLSVLILQNQVLIS